MTFLGQQRCIAGHLNDIAIALDVAKIERLSQCRLMSASARSILTHIDFRSLSVVMIIVVLMVDEPCGRFIVMLIDHVEEVLVLIGKLPAFDIVSRWEVERTCRATKEDLWMALAKGFGYHLTTLFEHRGDDILIANAEILHVERGRMTGIGTHLRPL